jgi:hypothetical protein
VFSSSVSSVGSNIIKNGHKRKTASSSTAIERLDTSLNVKDQPPNEIAAFRRVYRWSTGCSSVRPGGGLMRFLLNGVDARGNSNDPDSEFSFFFLFLSDLFISVLIEESKHCRVLPKKKKAKHLVRKNLFQIATIQLNSVVFFSSFLGLP